MRNPFRKIVCRSNLSWKGVVEQDEEYIVIEFPSKNKAILQTDA